MTVYRKKGKNGKVGKVWYYEFKFNGKRYNRSTGKTTEIEAKVVEKRVRAELKERHELFVSDGATNIKLDVAVELAIAKPSKRVRSEQKNKRKRQVWGDFIAWLNSNFPKTKHLNEVTRLMAEAYINELIRNGKFIKVIKHKGKGAYAAQTKLAASSVNSYHKELEWVFKKLLADAGLKRNPFSHIEKQKVDNVKREAYTNDEIKLIEERIEEFPFCEYIYYVGTGTGMRMGNICMLDWSDIDMESRVIKCENRKTGGKLIIPILNGLYEYLQGCTPKASGYVSDVHATRYSSNPSGISTEFTKFLNRVGIETKIVATKRQRASNVKGVHAMRHTFIYRAMLRNIPVNVIQCIVGHVDEDITKMYADHVIAEDAQRAMAGFSISEAKNDKHKIISEIIGKLNLLSVDKVMEISRIISSL